MQISSRSVLFTCALLLSVPARADGINNNGGGGGSGITALTGDCTATGPGSAAITCTKTNGTLFGSAAAQSYTASTWTPVVTASVTPGTPAYTFQVGSYEQVGRLVVAHFSVSLSGWTGTPNGNVTITGLPAASSSNANDYGACVVGQYAVSALAASNAGITAYISPGTTVINLQSGGASGVSAITTANAGTTPQFLGVCFYHT
jgi:hypothetical protein